MKSRAPSGVDLNSAQGLAQREGEVGAQLEVVHHLGATDVEVAIAKTDVLGDLDVVLDLERRRLGGVQDLHRLDVDLNLAGHHRLVDLVVRARAHDAPYEDRPLCAHGLGRAECLLLAHVGIELELREARTVAEVDEDQAAVVAAAPDPAGKGDLGADVPAAELATGVRVHAKRHFFPLVFRPVP